MRQTSHIQSIHSFQGRLDTDSDLRYVEDGNYVAALNMRGQYGSKLGRKVNIKGNEEIASVLPAGTNLTLHTVEDQQNQWLIYFNRNSNGNHGIYLLDTTDKTVGNNKGTVIPLIEGPILNFEFKIDHAEVIDGRFLCWTDGTPGGGSILGNPPRCIDILKAKRNKLLCYYLDLDLEVGDTLTIRVGNDVTTDFFTVTTVVGLPGLVKAALDAIPGITSTLCNGNRIEVCADVIDVDVNITSSGNVYFFPQNHYDDLSEYHLSLIKKPPSFAPLAYYTKAGINTRVYGYQFQFRTRFIYFDGSISAWSPLSQVPTNIDALGKNDDDYARIEVDLNVDELQGPLRELVQYVELGVMFNNTDLLKSVKVYEVQEFDALNQIVIFDNLGTYPVVASDDDGDATNQVLKFFDNIPRIAKALSLLADDKGRARLLLSNNLEGYDTVDCPDVLIADNPVAVTSGTNDAIQQNFKYLKSFGIYTFGIVYEDDYNRKSSVVEIGTIETTIDPRMVSQLTFTINHAPPSWATKYRIVRSKNQRTANYLQTIPSAVEYVSIVNSNTAPAVVPFGSANHTCFTIAINDDNISEEDVVIFFNRQGDSKIYTPQNNDRVRTVENFSGNLMTAFDRPVVGYSIEGDVLKVYTEVQLVSDPENQIIEFYKTTVASDETFYETGVAFRIEGGVHLGNAQDQNATDPAIVNFAGGDTYWKFVSLATFGVTGLSGITTFERPSLYDGDVVSEDIGRLNAITTVGEVYYRNGLRMSDAYVPDSSINGLPSFRVANVCYTDRKFGMIEKTVVIRDVLLAICRYKIQPYYIGRNEILDVTGQQLLGTSNDLLNAAQEIKEDLGTQHAESIAVFNGNAYGWDEHHGRVWRYSSNGAFAVSDYLNNILFRELGKQLTGFTGNTVYGGFERKYNAYYLTFSEIQSEELGQFSSRTIAFEEGLDGFLGDYSFVPEQYGSVGVNFYAFKDGRIYLQDSDVAPYCNFFGIQYDSNISLVCNKDLIDNKLFWNIRVQSNNLFWSNSIKVVMGNQEMVSRLKENKWNEQEGMYYAEFLRDMNDPSFGDITDLVTREVTGLLQGRKLRGEYMVINLQALDPSVENVLNSVYLEYSLSKETIV